jgi:arabinogalactan endo-1,4-beta-galactosidase
MNINDAYPSNYLRASDLKGRNIPVVIDRIEQEKVGNDTKMVLYFQNKTKGMILNKTNANNIAALYSPETDAWAGRQLIIFEAMVDFKGQTVPALRVRGPMPKDNGHKPAMAPSYPPPGLADDEAPF